MNTIQKTYITILLILIPMIAAFAGGVAGTSVSVIAAPVKQTVLPENLVPSNGIYYGYYQETYNIHPEKVETHVATDESPSLAMYYQDWGSKGTLDYRYMDRLTHNGVIPIVTWEPWNAQTDTKTNTTEYTPQAITSGKYDPFIREWARDAARYKKPFYLRFAHEMNGNWYPWGNANGNTPEDYKAMWIYVHDIFEEEGATNVVWLWSPNNTDNTGSTASILDYYPGSAYVDWVGFSGFNWGASNSETTWKSFEEIIKEPYDVLSITGKPIMLAETASVSKGGDKAAWFKEALATLPKYPNIKAVIFFNQDFNDSDFSLGSGLNYEAVAKEYIMQNEYYVQSPYLDK
ncbi:MAG: hypothetical protein H0W89_02165 [Candidatus Levybacteria bacterium]|nr:hypothetical protein [Candidatus Levybacteria bacterium]